MGALYKGFIASAVLSAIVLWPVTDYVIGMDTQMNTRGIAFTGLDLYICGIVGLVVTGGIIWITEYYTGRSEEHTSELQSLMRISYAVFCLKKKKNAHNSDQQTPEPTT